MDRPLSTSKLFKRFAITCSVLGSTAFLVFKWSVFDYPYNSPYPSPNGEYYVTMHQTPWEKLWRTYPDEYATARLYDKTGKLLYEGKTRFGDGAGPDWSAGFEDEPRYKHKVFMDEDDQGKLWIYELPTSPGLKLLPPALLERLHHYSSTTD